MKLTRLQNIALLIFFFSINFEVWDPLNTGGSFSVSKLTGFLYFFTILPQLKQFLFVKDIKSVLRPIWLFFLLLTLISLINANAVSSSFFDFSLFQNIILLWVLINHERKEPNIFSKGLFSFALGSIALSLLYHAGIGVAYHGGRVSLFGDNENTIGMRMSISTVILLIVIIQNPLNLSKIRYLFIISLPVMVKLMAETGSRIAFIAFVLMFSVGTLLLRTKKSWYKFAILLLGSFVFAYVIQYILSSEVIMIRLLKTTEEGDLAGRDAIWQKLIPLIKENPIVGVGKTGYAEYTQKVFFGARSPHNVLIEVLCYTGIIGLIFYLSFIYRAFKFSWTAYKLHKLILPILLFIPIAGYLFSGQILTNKIGWSILAYAIALGALNSTSQIQNQNN